MCPNHLSSFLLSSFLSPFLLSIFSPPSTLPSFIPQSLHLSSLLFLSWWNLCSPGWPQTQAPLSLASGVLGYKSVCTPTRLCIFLLWGLKAVAEPSQPCQEPEALFSPPSPSPLLLRSEFQRAPEGWEWKRARQAEHR